MARLFFALWPDGATRKALNEVAQSILIGDVQCLPPVPPANFHLTLAFLGELTPQQEADARAAAKRLTHPAIDLRIDVAASFADSGAWWLGSNEPSPGLTELRSRLEAALDAAEIPYDGKAFVPHVTILRNAPRPLKPMPIQRLAWHASTFSLVRSNPDGSYEVVGRWNLSDAPPPPQLALI